MAPDPATSVQASPHVQALRVFLAEHDPHARSALRLLLEHEAGVRVVGEAATAVDLLRHIERSHAQLVLLDWELPEMEARNLVASVRSSCPGAVLIALSVRAELRPAAMSEGVDDFICKGDAPDRLLRLVQQARDRAQSRAQNWSRTSATPTDESISVAAPFLDAEDDPPEFVT